MIALIVLPFFISTLILSYKLGLIHGYRKGFDEYDNWNMKDFGEYIKSRKTGNENEKPLASCIKFFQ